MNSIHCMNSIERACGIYMLSQMRVILSTASVDFFKSRQSSSFHSGSTPEILRLYMIMPVKYAARGLVDAIKYY